MPKAAVKEAPRPIEPSDARPPRMNEAGLARLRLDTMGVADVPEVAEIERSVFPDPWSADSFLAEVERRPDVGWPIVVRDGDGIAAYAIVWFIVDEIHIGNIAVHRGRQGRGIGRWLMDRILAEGRGRSMVFGTLEVRPSNRAALALYESLGFRRIAVRRRYYRNNDEDAWVLGIALDPAGEHRLG